MEEKKIKRKKKKENLKMIIIIAIIAICFICAVPYEQLVFRFETPEKALKFNYIDGVKHIIAKVEIEGYAYITYVDRKGEWIGDYVIKDKRGWISPIKQIVSSNKSKRKMGEYSIISYKVNGQYLLVIDSTSTDQERLIRNISDSLKTKFEFVRYKYNDIYGKQWIGTIKEYPEDYKIYLDTEVISL